MEFTKKRHIPRTTTMQRSFLGYCPQLSMGDSQWYHEENLSSREFPLLRPRSKRRLLDPAEVNALGELNGLVMLRGKTLHYGGNELTLPLESGDKRLLSFGAYLIVLPDMVWVNTVDHSFGTCNIRREYEIPLGILWCDENGEPLDGVVESSEPPENQNQYWIDSFDPASGLRYCSKETGKWVPMEPTYLRIRGEGIGVDLSRGSQILMDDCPYLSPIVGTGLCTVYGCGRDYLVLEGKIPGTRLETETLQFKVTSPVPIMDHVIQHENRLWGCRYGLDHNGNYVNEIYASALGDFKSWYSFQGISSDSYVLSLGEQGPFTGAAVVGGHPVFFKERSIHKIYGNRPSSYQLHTTICAGVAPGSSRSMAYLQDTLVYLGSDGFYVYDGSYPVKISTHLGGQVYRQGIGGVLGNIYYCSVLEKNGTPVILTYDSYNKIWHRETGARPLEFQQSGEILYYRTEDPGLFAIGTDTGTPAEREVHWEAVTGLIRREKIHDGYFTGLRLRLSGEIGSYVHVFSECNSFGAWEHLGTIAGGRLYSRDIHFRIAKCDHLRLKFQGVGDMVIHAITTVMEG